MKAQQIVQNCLKKMNLLINKPNVMRLCVRKSTGRNVCIGGGVD